MLETLRNKFFARQQESDAKLAKSYHALVVDALDGKLDDSAKSVERVQNVLAEARRSWSNLEEDVAALREQRALEDVCKDESKHRKTLKDARARKSKLESEWAEKSRAHTDAVRAIDREISAAQAQVTAIAKAKQRLGDEFPESIVARQAAADRDAEVAAATVEQLERQLAEVSSRLADDEVFLAEEKALAGKGGVPDKERIQGVQTRINELTRRRDAIVRDLAAAKQAGEALAEPVGA